MNRHRPRRPRKDGAALRYLDLWRREVEYAERLHRSGGYVYTPDIGCPCCEGRIWDDSRERLEALVRRRGKHAHQLRVKVQRLDERFRAVTVERGGWASASWWRAAGNRGTDLPAGETRSPLVCAPCHASRTMTDTTALERCACPDEHATADGRCAEPSIRSGDPADSTLARYTWCGCCMADCPDVHGPEGRLPAHYRYEAQWSDEDGEFVGLATEFPSLSFLAPTPYEALGGIKSLVAEVLRDMASTGESPPVPTPKE